jgi:hypothetical protein
MARRMRVTVVFVEQACLAAGGSWVGGRRDGGLLASYCDGMGQLARAWRILYARERLQYGVSSLAARSWSGLLALAAGACLLLSRQNTGYRPTPEHGSQSLRRHKGLVARAASDHFNMLAPMCSCLTLAWRRSSAFSRGRAQALSTWSFHHLRSGSARGGWKLARSRTLVRSSRIWSSLSWAVSAYE